MYHAIEAPFTAHHGLPCHSYFVAVNLWYITPEGRRMCVTRETSNIIASSPYSALWRVKVAVQSDMQLPVYVKTWDRHGNLEMEATNREMAAFMVARHNGDKNVDAPIING